MSKTKKVCLFTISLAGGGAEKSTAILSNILEKQGYEVHIVSLNNEIKYSYSGKLFNFGLIKGNSLVSKAKGFVKMRRYLKFNNFDYIIDSRTHQLSYKELFYMYYLYRRFQYIYIIHSNNLNLYFPPVKAISGLIIKNAAKLVCVSKEIENTVKLRFKTFNTQTIYNPIEDLHYSLPTSTTNDGHILFLGRLIDNVKNVSLLLEAYNISRLRNNIKIKIFGDGEDKDMLKAKIDELGISEFVKIFPFDIDVEKQILNARFLVLTSHFEGFPMVLIESLALGVPVVSVNCKGSGEIVQHEKNGLLVENYNVVALARAMERMFNDEELYKHCKNNAKQSVAHLQGEKIGAQWAALLQSLKQK